MPAPRRPWPPSRPSRPPSLHESACERASRPQLPSPSSSRDPSRLTVCGTRTRRERSSPGKSSSTWRAPAEKMLRVRLRRGAAAVSHGGALAMEARAGGAGEKSKRRRRRAQAAAQSGCAGGAGAHGRRWASASAGGGGSTCRRAVASGGGAGARRRCGETAAARREGGGGSRWMRVKQRGKRGGGPSMTQI